VGIDVERVDVNDVEALSRGAFARIDDRAE
jgi:hypothetical protein